MTLRIGDRVAVKVQKVADDAVEQITKLAAASVATLETEIRKRVSTVQAERGIASYEQAFAFCVASDTETRHLYSKRADAEAELRDAPTVVVGKAYAEKREPIARERAEFIEAHALRKGVSLYEAEVMLKKMGSPTLERLDKQLTDLEKEAQTASTAAYAAAKKRAKAEIEKRAPPQVARRILKRPAHDALVHHVTSRAEALGVPYEVALTRGLAASGGDQTTRELYESARCEAVYEPGKVQ